MEGSLSEGSSETAEGSITIATPTLNKKSYSRMNNARNRPPSKALEFHSKQLHTRRCGPSFGPFCRYRVPNIRSRDGCLGYTTLTRHCVFPIPEEAATSHSHDRTSPLHRYTLSLAKYRLLQKGRRFYRDRRRATGTAIQKKRKREF